MLLKGEVMRPSPPAAAVLLMNQMVVGPTVMVAVAVSVFPWASVTV
jgi:hypothetical protein